MSKDWAADFALIRRWSKDFFLEGGFLWRARNGRTMAIARPASRAPRTTAPGAPPAAKTVVGQRKAAVPGKPAGDQVRITGRIVRVRLNSPESGYCIIEVIAADGRRYALTEHPALEVEEGMRVTALAAYSGIKHRTSSQKTRKSKQENLCSPRVAATGCQGDACRK